MAAPISPGEVLKIAKGVYKVYKRFHDAPKEMKHLGEQVRLVTAIISQSDNAIMHLDFLKTPEGRNLLDILNGHLREMKKILQRCKDVAKQWRKAEKNFWRRAPFVLYTMRAIPGLRADLKFELDLVESVKTQAFQIGVPAALKQLEAKVAAQNKQRKAQSQDEFIATEKKRKAACTALKMSSMTNQPATVAEKKEQMMSTLRQSGLPDDEVQTLISLHEKAIKEAVAKLSTKQGAASVTSKKSQPKKKQDQSNKPSAAGTAKPKIVVIQPKSKDSTGAEGKQKNNQKESTPSESKLKAPSTKPKDAESEKSKQSGSNSSTPKRSNSPANGNQKIQDNKTAPESKPTKEPEKGKNAAKQTNNKNAEGDKNTTKQNNNKSSEGDKNTSTGKQTGKSDMPKKAPQQKPEIKSDTDTSTKPNTKQNSDKISIKSSSNQSEAPAKQPKFPAKAKTTNDNSGKASEQAKQPSDKSTKGDDKKKSSNSSSSSTKTNDTTADAKMAEKPKGQKETLTATPKEAKSRSPNRNQGEQAKKKPDAKDTKKVQPAVAAA